MRNTLAVLACLTICLVAPAAAQPQPELVADLRPGSDGSHPLHLTEFNGSLFFTAVRDDVGRELWIIDGSGIRLAADIRPGTSGSFPDPNRDLLGSRPGFTEYDGSIFFSAIGESGYRATWKHDGTTLESIPAEAGTHFIVFGDELLFSPLSMPLQQNADIGFFRYDGQTVEQIPEYCGTPCNRYYYDFELFEGELYFAAGQLYTHLVAYNGVEVQFKEAFPSRLGTGGTPEFVVYKDDMYFAADGGINGTELWKYDGTTATQVTNIYPEGDADPQFLTVYDERLCFSAESPETGAEFWCYDGQNTTLYELNPGVGSGTPLARHVNRMHSHRPFIEYDGKLFFNGFSGDQSEGAELWSFDGTQVSLEADINSGGASAPQDFVIFDDKLFFAATESSTGQELWSFDGTVAQRMSDIDPGLVSSRPRWMTVVNETLYFTADDDVNGTELWKLEGSSTNAQPSATDDDAHTQQDTSVEIDVLANDADPDGDALVLDSFTQPANGTVTNGVGTLIYEPDAGFVGSDEFTYTVIDGNGGSATATVSVTVSPATLTLAVSEQITVEDLPNLLPGLTLAISESITVSDQPELLTALLLAINETIAVSDAPTLSPSILLRIAEDVTVSDSPELIEELLLQIAETIEVSDDPDLIASLLLSIRETVTVADDYGLLTALLLRIEESITVDDEPTLLTTQDLVQILVVSIQELSADGTLVRGQSNSLLKKLAEIIEQYENARYRTASNQLRAFVNQVESYRAGGVLADEQADAFQAQAAAIETLLDQESESRVGKGGVAGAEDIGTQTPEDFALAPAYPNPFNPVTTITYSIPEQAHVRISVYDVLGQRVALLMDREQPAGSYAVLFNAGDLPSGSYVYRIDAGAYSDSRTMTLVK